MYHFHLDEAKRFTFFIQTSLDNTNYAGAVRNRFPARVIVSKATRKRVKVTLSLAR